MAIYLQMGTVVDKRGVTQIIVLLGEYSITVIHESLTKINMIAVMLLLEVYIVIITTNNFQTTLYILLQ